MIQRYDSFLTSLSAVSAAGNDDYQQSPWRKSNGFNLLDGASSGMSDAMPRPLHTRTTATDITTHHQQLLLQPPDYREEWGMEQRHPPKDFASTAPQIVDQAFAAIAGTLYGETKLNPHIVSNAMSRNMKTRRPVSQHPRDAGRIGIELDGTEHILFENDEKEPHRLSAGAALRRISLLLAAQLSHNGSWKDYEQDVDDGHRCVTVCFNTLQQALAASRDLQRLPQTSEANIDSTAYMPHHGISGNLPRKAGGADDSQRDTIQTWRLDSSTCALQYLEDELSPHAAIAGKYGGEDGDDTAHGTGCND